MKVIIFLFVLFLSSNTSAQFVSVSASDNQFIKNFYTEYLKAVTKKPQNKVEIEMVKQKYISAAFLTSKETKDEKIDPYMNTNDYDVTWYDDIEIYRKGPRSNEFSIYLDPKKKRKIVRLKLIKENNQSRIEIIL
jgi:hypothetical protein